MIPRPNMGYRSWHVKSIAPYLKDEIEPANVCVRNLFKQAIFFIKMIFVSCMKESKKVILSAINHAESSRFSHVTYTLFSMGVKEHHII